MSDFLAIFEKLDATHEETRLIRLQLEALNEKLATLIDLHREQNNFKKCKVAAVVPPTDYNGLQQI